MNLISLKNVSKFYYSKGVIASGFNRINLDLNIGEFVAITGESGSGKSTLLNVLSGLDSYEEGEMYINGEETSHYTEKDFEDYRRKYIGNIFQSFNLVNSYTVYQNIELVLLLNGNKKKDIKKNVLELINKVGLRKFKNQKVSKLSGGQKQRVAIARALAKETPIIIADEPTGNLDSKSASDTLRLLSEISKDKLVIVVTHNYEQIEKYVTRKLTMSDGRIIEDKNIKNPNDISDIKTSNYKNITIFNKIRLGIRNAFNIKVKFVLLLFVYLFILLALSVEYASFKNDEYIIKSSGENSFLNDRSDKRIILTKNDDSYFSDEDYNKLDKITNLNKIIKEDYTIEGPGISFSSEPSLYLYGRIKNYADFNKNIDYGRMPQHDNEFIIEAGNNSVINDDNYELFLDQEFNIDRYYFFDEDIKNKVYKVVGIRFNDSNNDDDIFYVSDNLAKTEYKFLLYDISEKKLSINNKTYSLTDAIEGGDILPLDTVKEGTIVLPYQTNQFCKNNNCNYKNILINISNRYYTDELSLKVSGVYSNKFTYRKYTNLKHYEQYISNAYINPKDYDRLFSRPYYQTSVYVDDLDLIDNTVNDLNSLGYKTFVVKDSLYVSENVEVIQILKVIVTIIIVVVLFVICYFVTKIIIKSRKVYFSTIRMLGSTKKVCKKLLSIELLVISNISCIIFATILILTKFNYIDLEVFSSILEFLNVFEYILLYLVINTMSFIISLKYAKEIFKDSAITSLKGDE